MVDEKDVADESQKTPVVEEQAEGAKPQVASEEKTVSDQDKNWTEARRTMKEQSEMIRELKAELEEVKGSKLTAKEVKEVTSAFGNRDKDDLPTIGEVEAYFQKKESEWAMRQAELETRSRYPDMDEVINKYGKQLPESVRHAILRAPNPHKAAYEACKSSEAYYKDQLASSQHKDAVVASENLKKAGNASAVGGSAALSKASYYESMDTRELLEMSDRYIRGVRK